MPTSSIHKPLGIDKALYDQLFNSDFRLRLAAFRKMAGRYYDSTAHSGFIQALKSEQESALRKLLLTVLNGRQVPMDKEALVCVFDDNDEEVRALAVNALKYVSRSQSIKRPLRAGLNDPEEHVRLAAIQVLGALQDTNSIQHILLTLNTDRSENERLAAVKAAGEWIEPVISDCLSTVASHDSSSKVRELATRVLALQKNAQIVDEYLTAPSIETEPAPHTVAELRNMLAEPRIIDELIAALDDQDAPARPVVAKTLSKLQDPDLIEAFARALADRDKRVNTAALDYLRQFDDERSINALVSGLSDKRESVCVAVLSIVEKRNGPHLTDALLQALQNTPAPRGWYIISLLAAQQEQRPRVAMAILDYILKHIRWYARDHTCQFAVSFMLAQICTREVFFRLVSLLNDPEASIEVRSFIATILRELMTPRTRQHQHMPEQHMLKPLATALYDPRHNEIPEGRKIRHDLAYTLSQIDHPAVIEPLLGLLSLPEPSFWEVEIIAKYTGASAIEPFLALLKNLSRLPELNRRHSLKLIIKRLMTYSDSDSRIHDALIAFRQEIEDAAVALGLLGE